MHSFIHAFIRSFIHSFIHSFIDSFIHSYFCTFTLSHFHTFIHSFIHSFFLSFFLSFIHSFIHTYIHTYIRSYIHWICPSIQSFCHWFAYVRTYQSLFMLAAAVCVLFSLRGTDQHTQWQQQFSHVLQTMQRCLQVLAAAFARCTQNKNLFRLRIKVRAFVR